MVVAQVIGNLSIGGAERLFVNLCNSLSADTPVVILIGDVSEVPSLVDDLRSDIKVHHLHVRKRSWFRDVRALARLISDSGCDVIHTHMFWPNLYGALAARLAGLPLVTSEHGRNEWKNRWHRFLEVHVISRAAKVRLCVSKDILERRMNVDGIPAKLLRLVPNGTLVPPKSSIEKQEVIIGSVGRLVDAKDFPTLIKAMAILVGRGVDARLEIVGEGPERATIENVIKEADIGSYVKLAGSQTNVDEWLARWSVFASSSVREGQPIALLEAMAAGLPCAVTGVGGVPDTIADGSEGIVVPPGQPDQLADGLQKLIGNRELRESFGTAGRQRIIRDFSIDSLAETCHQVYASVMSGNEATRGASSSS